MEDLPGAHPRGEDEHCEFYWLKFLDPNYSDAARRSLEEEPDDNPAHGYTNIGEEGETAGRWWICERCFEDFKDEFAWVVVDSDPNAWPYE